MTDFKDTYRQLLQVDSAHQRRWLLDHRPAEIPLAHWWLTFIDAAVADVRYTHKGWPQTRPRAGTELAAALIDWALKENFPTEYAIENLVQLIMIAFAAGRDLDALPTNAQPDNVARQALTQFGFTRAEAVARAAELRSRPATDDDLVQPGENISESLRLLSATSDYKDYHRLLCIQRMLNDLKPVTGFLTDTDLAADLGAWFKVLPELDPVPINPVDQLSSHTNVSGSSAPAEPPPMDAGS